MKARSTWAATFGVAFAIQSAIWLALGKPYAIGSGIVVLGYGVYRVFTSERPDRARAAGTFWGVVLGCAAAALVVAATYVVFRRATFAACDAAARTRTLAERKAAWADVRSRGWLARRLDAPALEGCYEEQLFEQLEPGKLCADWPMDDVPCTCGDAQWPKSVTCGDRRAFCGCLPKAAACVEGEDCCSGACEGGRCAGGYFSGQTRRLHCVAP